MSPVLELHLEFGIKENLTFFRGQGSCKNAGYAISTTIMTLIPKAYTQSLTFYSSHVLPFKQNISFAHSMILE